MDGLGYMLSASAPFKPWIQSSLVWLASRGLTILILRAIAVRYNARRLDKDSKLNAFRIACLAKLFAFSRREDYGISEMDTKANGTKIGNLAKLFACSKGDDDDIGLASEKVHKLLNEEDKIQAMARHVYRTFVLKSKHNITAHDVRVAFDSEEECEHAFEALDLVHDGNISLKQLEKACAVVARDRDAIQAGLRRLDTVLIGLDYFLLATCFMLAGIVFVMASNGALVPSITAFLLALTWLVSSMGQRTLQCVVFVLIEHPYDVGDRVFVYGNMGTNNSGDDYFVKHVSLFYTEFKKFQGQVMQVSNMILNDLAIINYRRSGMISKTLNLSLNPVTSLDVIDRLRRRVTAYVTQERGASIELHLRSVNGTKVEIDVMYYFKTDPQNEHIQQDCNPIIGVLKQSMSELGLEGSVRA